MSNKGYIAIIGILVILCAGLGYKFYSFKEQSESHALTQENEQKAIELEKGQLELDLQLMMIGYDTLQTENETLLNAMAVQKMELEGLLKKVKNGNYEISSLKAEAQTLRNIMQHYVHEIDSLNTLTQNLTAQVGDLEDGIEQRDMKIDGLEEKTGNLENMVASGQALQATGMSGQGIRLTNSGNQKEANKASRVDMIKSCFTVIKNPIAPPGNKVIYLSVVDSNGKTLAGDGGAQTFELDGAATEYSVSRQIDYRNETMDVCVYYTVVGELSKGDYSIFVYEGGKLIGMTDLSLK